MKSVTASAPIAFAAIFLFGGLVASVKVQANDARPTTPYKVTSQTKLRPAPRFDWGGQAVALERQGNWLGLLQLGQQWTRAEPRNATAWFALGRANGELNRNADAISAYKRTLQLQPDDFYARNNLGNAYRNSSSYLQAMYAYRDAVRSNPDYIPAWQNLGLTFFQLRGVAGVSQALQKLHTSDAALAEAWYKLAIQYSQSRDARVAQQAISVLHSLSAARRERMFAILLEGF
jgi:tetratricopeptide (TPR) repeat protein